MLDKLRFEVITLNVVLFLVMNLSDQFKCPLVQGTYTITFIAFVPKSLLMYVVTHNINGDNFTYALCTSMLHKVTISFITRVSLLCNGRVSLLMSSQLFTMIIDNFQRVFNNINSELPLLVRDYREYSYDVINTAVWETT